MKLSYRSRLALIALLLALSTLFASCNLLGGTQSETTTQETIVTNTPSAEDSSSDETTFTPSDDEQQDTSYVGDVPSDSTTEPEDTSSEPENTSSSEPENTTSSEPENTSSNEPVETTPPDEPENTTSSKPENTTSTEPEDTSTSEPEDTPPEQTPTDKFDYNDVPAFTNQTYFEINGNVPYFTKSDYTTTSYERYSVLDTLGRCGVAMACIGKDLMPTEERESISSVTPSGWVQASYDGTYLYDRCHLIGFQLTGENANKQNLITGTKYFNVAGMLGFENMVADYIKETNNHVLYRVTPVFVGNELVARGVLMEAWSVEDNGDGICFNVFVYNVQPGIEIDYATGKSQEVEIDPGDGQKFEYVANKSSHKFHYASCSWVDKMSESNKEYFYTTHEEMIQRGYDPCGTCKP